MAPRRQVGFRLDEDVLDWLKKRGQKNVRSMAAEVTVLVRAEMAREAAVKKRKTQ
jgi:hypothetical protein